MAQQADATWIRRLRVEANLTQEQLSVRLNISTSTLRKWERGDAEPSMTLDQWVIFSEAVRVPLADLPVMKVSLVA
jgi:transcriptional regulator with XRE-family HTH domain